MRVCNKCHVEKPLDEFHKHQRSAGGRRLYCNKCNAAAVTAWRAANPERRRATDRKAYAKRKQAKLEAGQA